MEKNNQSASSQSNAAAKPAKQIRPNSVLKSSEAKKKPTRTGGKKMYDGVKDILFLIDYLIQHSSPEHKVSEAQLMTALFSHKNPDDIRSKNVYNTTIGEAGIEERVKRFLKLFVNTDVFSFLRIKESSENFKGPKRNALKYYVEGPLSESTVRILRDSIAVYPYAEQKITKDIIKELNSITNIYNRREYNLPEMDALKYPGTYYKNLQEINYALSTSTIDKKGAKLDKKLYNELNSKYEKNRMHSKKVSKLQFEYYKYDYDEKRRKITLVIRPYKIDNQIKTIHEANPLMLIWSNGYYYLITYAYFNGAYHYYNYRVDRMKNVKCLTTDADEFNDTTYFRNNEFDPKLYIAKNPVMHASPEKFEKIVIRCKRFILNNAIDTFGFDIKVLKCDEDNVEFETKNLSSQGVLMFALEYCDYCEILSPTELRGQMKNYADSMALKYQQNSTDDDTE